MSFPLGKEDWYQLRDDRTKRIDNVSGFEDFRLGVVISPQIESSYPIQVMTVASLNMLARWCRNITIQMPDVNSCLPIKYGEDLKAVLQKELPRIDPYGQFIFENITADRYSQILFIGPSESKNEQYGKRGVWIDGVNWVSGVGSGVPSLNIEHKGQNPVGAVFASCLGVAELFRQAVGLPSADGTSWYSLYDHQKIGNPSEAQNANYVSGFNFGTIYQIGCGAVGSSLDFLFSLTDWRANLYLIDYDKVDVTNCNRSLTFTAYDAIAKRSKVDSCADILKNNIKPIKFNGSYAKFIEAGKSSDNPADIILCLANEENIWATIQSNIPPITFHATTTPNWAINFGRHIPKKEWCIMCRFSGSINNNFIPPCAEGKIRHPTSNKEILGVLPFLSTTAAAMIFAEMAKMSLPNYPVNKNSIEFSTKSFGTHILQLQRKAMDCAYCRNQPMLKHLTNSKFWGLSA